MGSCVACLREMSDYNNRYIDTIKWLLKSSYNIDKIFCKNSNKIFLIPNSGNFKACFKIYKVTPSMGCLYDIHI